MSFDNPLTDVINKELLQTFGIGEKVRITSEFVIGVMRNLARELTPEEIKDVEIGMNEKIKKLTPKFNGTFKLELKNEITQD